MTTRRLPYRHEVEHIVKLPPSMLYEAIAEGDSQADPRQREGCPVYEDEAAVWRAATAPGARWTATVIRPAARRRASPSSRRRPATGSIGSETAARLMARSSGAASSQSGRWEGRPCPAVSVLRRRYREGRRRPKTNKQLPSASNGGTWRCWTAFSARTCRRSSGWVERWSTSRRQRTARRTMSCVACTSRPTGGGFSGGSWSGTPGSARRRPFESWRRAGVRTPIRYEEVDEWCAREEARLTEVAPDAIKVALARNGLRRMEREDPDALVRLWRAGREVDKDGTD